MNEHRHTADDEGEQLTLTAFRKIGEIVEDVLAHLAEHQPKHIEARRRPHGSREGEHAEPEEPNLSRGELEVLRDLAADGASTKDIARRLGIKPDTAKARLQTALRKLGMSSRTQAALWYRERQDRAHLADHRLQDRGRVPAEISDGEHGGCEQCEIGCFAELG